MVGCGHLRGDAHGRGEDRTPRRQGRELETLRATRYIVPRAQISSPLVGEGGRGEQSEPRPGEGYLKRDASPGFLAPLGSPPLPQGERGRRREQRTRHAEDRRELRSHRRGERLRGAGARERADRAGARHHQPRHRPARFPHARAHRRGRHQGDPRRTSRLHGGERHSGAARGGGGRSAQAVRRRRSRPTK